MGRRPKVTDWELGEAIRAGMSRKEICQRYGISPQALSQREKKLGVAASKAALLFNGKEIQQQQIDANAQILKINETANRWMDKVEQLLESKQADQIQSLSADLEALRKDITPETADTLLNPLIAKLEKLKIYDLNALDRLVMVMAEVRKQLELLAKAAAVLIEGKRMAEVQQAILTEIGAESAECKARIIRRLGGLQSTGLLFAGDGWT